MAKSTDMVRFDTDFDCGQYNSKSVHEEGILLVFKTDIVAYSFPVRTYKKELTTQQSYRDLFRQYLLGKEINVYPMPKEEIQLVNKRGKCYSVISMTQTYAHGDNKFNKTFVAYHKDDYRKVEMQLFPLDVKNSMNKRYISTKDPFVNYGYVWFYHTSSSINCIVTDAVAKSKYPFDFFALTTGETIEASPFFDKVNGKTFNEDLNDFSVIANYTMLKDIGPEALLVEQRIPKMAFLKKGDAVFSWEIKEENSTICLLKHWSSLKDVIRSKNNKTYHFIAKELTASFVTPHTNITLTDGRETCIIGHIEPEIDKIYNEEYNETHIKIGSYQMYRTTGDLLLVWQPLRRKNLAQLELFMNGTNGTNFHGNGTHRSKRDVHNFESKRDLLYVQLQYLYDSLREYINGALRQLAHSWCLDQKRTISMLSELSKINPSTIVSLVYGEAVSAKWIGDVLSISKCTIIDQKSVHLKKSMKIDHGENRGLCYSRPVVQFSYENSTDTHYGQLGVDNEILLGNHRVENCEESSTKLFVSGEVAYVFKDYIYVNTTSLKNIEALDAYIGLNIDLMEDTDFQMLQLYTKDELNKANVLDLETILREYNAYKSTLYSLKSDVIDNSHTYFSGINDLLSGLGSVGKAIGNVVGAVGGAFAEILGGIAKFISNPFGGFLLLVLVVVAGIVIIVVFTKQRQTFMKPIEYLFPYTTNAQASFLNKLPYDTTDSASGFDGYNSINTSREYTAEDAFKILQAIKKLDESFKEYKKFERKSRNHPSLIDRVMYRDYKPVPLDG